MPSAVPISDARAAAPEFRCRQRRGKKGGDQRHERHHRERPFDADPIGEHSHERTAKPPIPQPKPIMIDDTVAALIGAIVWPNVTLTGNVDCSRHHPPTRALRMSILPESERPPEMEPQ